MWVCTVARLWLVVRQPIRDEQQITCVSTWLLTWKIIVCHIFEYFWTNSVKLTLLLLRSNFSWNFLQCVSIASFRVHDRFSVIIWKLNNELMSCWITYSAYNVRAAFSRIFRSNIRKIDGRSLTQGLRHVRKQEMRMSEVFVDRKWDCCWVIVCRWFSTTWITNSRIEKEVEKSERG